MKLRAKILFFLSLLLFFAYPACGQENGVGEAPDDFERMRTVLGDESLPLVNLTFNMDSVNWKTYYKGQIEIVDPAARTEGRTYVCYDCNLRYRGASALVYEKKSFAVKLINAAGEDLDASIMGIRPENSWILDAMAVDRIRMRNRVCFDLWNEVSRTPYETDYGRRNGTKGVFVEVFVNGTYHGLYCLSDKVDRKLLGLKKAKVDKAGNVTVRGLLYKGNSWLKGWDLKDYADARTDTVVWNAWKLKVPDEYPCDAAWNPLQELIGFCADKNPAAEFEAHFDEHFYLENLLDYAVFVAQCGIGDTGYKNTYLSTVNVQERKRFLHTLWDLDMSFGGNYDGNYKDVLLSMYWMRHIGPFTKLVDKNMFGFNERLAERWGELAETVLLPSHVLGKIDEYAAQLVRSGAWEREYERWNGNPVPLQKDLNDELEYVKDWYRRSYANLARETGISPTGVSSNSWSAAPDDAWYTLSGVRVRTPVAKGIYIHNGKKIIR